MASSGALYTRNQKNSSRELTIRLGGARVSEPRPSVSTSALDVAACPSSGWQIVVEDSTCSC